MSDATGGSGDRVVLGDEFVAQARQQLDSSMGLIRHCLGQLDDAKV